MEKIAYKYEKFIKSLNALERSIVVFSRDNIDQDIKEHLVASVVKHFEMCYESTWKYLKLYLEVHYVEHIDSPKKVFKQCFVLGFIDEITTKQLLDMCEARNATTHTYDEENAQEICGRINDYYITFKKISTLPLMR
jgi:nucleotidyltransferase substrate binding protein (TIGR01987 family)